MNPAHPDDWPCIALPRPCPGGYLELIAWKLPLYPGGIFLGESPPFVAHVLFADELNSYLPPWPDGAPCPADPCHVVDARSES